MNELSTVSPPMFLAQFHHPLVQFIDGVDDDRLPCAQNFASEADWRTRFRMKSFAVIEEEHIANQIGFCIEQPDPNYVGSEYLFDLVADQIVDRLHLELRRQAFLDAVDNRQFGGALLGFLQQMLRFVEEPGVFERGAQRRGNRAEQTYFGVAVRILAFVIFDDNRSEHAVAADDRNSDQ